MCSLSCASCSELPYVLTWTASHRPSGPNPHSVLCLIQTTRKAMSRHKAVPVPKAPTPAHRKCVGCCQCRGRKTLALHGGQSHSDSGASPLYGPGMLICSFELFSLLCKGDDCHIQSPGFIARDKCGKAGGSTSLRLGS